MISAVIRIFIETLSGNLERIGRHFLLAGLVLFLVIASLNHSKATHLRAGEIIVRRDNCSSLTFTITVIVYMDKESSVKFGEGTLRLGDGSDPDGDEKVGFKLPEIDPVYRPDLGGLITTASFTYQHTYGAPGRYIISYFEHNRNADILNIANSVSNPFFIEAEINIDPFLGCNNSPVMLIPPIDKACTGVAFFHNPGAYDPDGDSLSFELVIPKKDVGTPVDNYRNPTSPEFFVKSDYLNEDKTGPPEISIDPVTGLFKWDAPGDDENSQGREYNVAFIIKEWRKKGDTWFQMGYVVRDMQILVEDCDNERPELVVPNDTCVVAGTLIDEKIFGLDPDNHLVKIEAFSQVFHISNPASYYPADGRLQSTLAPTDTANVRFNWQTDCSHVRDQPYQVVFKITDYPELGPKLTNFETWNITVVAPPPQWVDAQLDFPNKGVNLTWDEYTCQNAESIQVWRRVDSYNYVAGDCETGMPDYLGYELVDEVYPDTFNYFDDNHGAGLNVGAAYCYRLVASFSPAVGGGIGTESIISDEICLEPVIADAPVVTHVTVDTTDVQNGAVTISWRPPFDLDQALFGTDYHYEIQRGEGLAAVDFLKVGQTADTTFHDRGFNTEYHSYSYRIILYSNDASVAGPTDPIDTSATASTVWLQPTPLFKEIQLNWMAIVPWSNNTQDHPWHYIYRGTEGDSEADLLLIDSVNVNVQGFSYLDKGQYNNTPLEDTKTYCYYIITQGSYGNPKIDEPLLNKSQKVCAQPSDDIPPCTPIMTSKTIPCDEFLGSASCDFAEFSNTLSWQPNITGTCQDDVLRYDIYVATEKGGEFQFLASTRDSTYIDANLTSFARCYKIQAIDRSGNKSDFAETVCYDNCPYYELPNVFTPSDIDGCNDVFSAYSARSMIGESGTTVCGDVDYSKCARFVRKVIFKVYNRWGTMVYAYESGGENTIYIDWDGRDLNGRELSFGTYYYHAEVTFDVVDPKEQVKDIKGWVRLIR